MSRTTSPARGVTPGLPTNTGSFKATERAESGLSLPQPVSADDIKRRILAAAPDAEDWAALALHSTLPVDVSPVDRSTLPEDTADYSAYRGPEAPDPSEALCGNCGRPAVQHVTSRARVYGACRDTFIAKDPTDLRVGDRIKNGEVITRLRTRGSTVVAWVDGDITPDGSMRVPYGASVLVSQTTVDLTDPDDFENEVERVFALEAPRRRGAVEDVLRDIRKRLTKAAQPSNASPLFNDDPRACNGRAKVNDDVIFESPMHGYASYRVVEKRPQRTILGSSWSAETGESEIHWGDSGKDGAIDVEYVLRNIVTGHESTSDLRQVGWRRVPAPGDQGPAAQRAAYQRAGA